MLEGHTQLPQKLLAWVRIVRNIKLIHFHGKFIKYHNIFEATLNDIMHALEFPNLRNFHIQEFSIFFQQDGAPPHYSASVRNYYQTHLDILWRYLKCNIFLNEQLI